MKKTLLVLAVVMALTGCATAQEIKRPGGIKEYIIQCGAGTGWDICYSKANEICPNGYEDISKDGGFNRKEFYIRCH